jgi:hypothetical protein
MTNWDIKVAEVVNRGIAGADMPWCMHETNQPAISANWLSNSIVHLQRSDQEQ